jgi:micrococcal nuclease
MIWSGTMRLPRGVTSLMVLSIVAIAGSPVRAGSPDTVPDPGGPYRVAEVIDGDTLVLEDGRQVRLVGIQAPKLSLGRPHVSTEPLAAESRAALESLVAGRHVGLRFGGRREDRHGRVLAHLDVEGGPWIQGEMLRQGMARVYSFSDNRALVGEMLEEERSARDRRAGMWSDPYFAVRSVADTFASLDSFQVVEGTVMDAAEVRGRVYLNFGADWREDFTVTISARDRRLFTRAGVDPLALAGRRVRVRGWLHARNGPMIDATHPEQIEVIER